MKIIGENLNVMGSVVGRAMKERDPKPIQQVALEQKEAGVDWIDINLGPAKKGGPELMEWVVNTVQEVVDDVPLALDTSNIDAIEAGLKVCKMRPLVNSIMARPERYTVMIPLVAKYNAQVVALMWGPEGLPRGRKRAGRSGRRTGLRHERGRHSERGHLLRRNRDPGEHSATPVDEPTGLPGDGPGYRPRGQIHLRAVQLLQRNTQPAHPQPDLHGYAGKQGDVLLNRRS